MALQGSDLLTAGHIPQPDRIVPTGTGQSLTMYECVVGEELVAVVLGDLNEIAEYIIVLHFKT